METCRWRHRRGKATWPRVASGRSGNGHGEKREQRIGCVDAAHVRATPFGVLGARSTSLPRVALRSTLGLQRAVPLGLKRETPAHDHRRAEGLICQELLSTYEVVLPRDRSCPVAVPLGNAQGKQALSAGPAPAVRRRRNNWRATSQRENENRYPRRSAEAGCGGEANLL